MKRPVTSNISAALLARTGPFWLALVFLCLSFAQSVFASAGSGITYHGRILKPDGTALESSNVQFKVQIRTGGTESCVMFEELQGMNMKNTGGVFSVTINDGTGTRQDASGLTIDQVFQNKGAFTFPTASCQSGSGATTNWSPNAADGRRIKVTFRDENMTNWEPLPDQMINFVPMAIEAKQVGGFTPFHLLRVEDAATSANSAPLTLAQVTELQALLGGTSTQFVKQSPNGVVFPNRSTDPASPAVGQIWYDTSTNQLKFYNGTAPQALGAAGGALPALANGQVWVGNASAVATAVTFSGDATLAPTGAVTLKNTGTAGTYAKVTTDAQGRVTVGAALTETDIPSLTTAGKVSGGAINAGTIGGSAAINTTGAITTTGTVTAANLSSTTDSTQSVRVFNGANSHFTTITFPGTTADFNFVLPVTAGASGNVLTTNGAGVLSWTAASTGSVTTVTGTAPITVGGTAAAPVVGVDAATTAAAGVVTLAASGGTTASTVVQATDARLSDSRAPNGSATGDLTGNYPAPTVAKIRGVGVGASAPVTGQVLRHGGATWDPSFVSFSDLRTALGATQIPTTCTTAQTWSYSSVSDTFSCANIAVAASQVTGLGTAAAKNIPASGNASTTEVVYGTDTRLTDARVPSGAAGGDLGGTYPNPTLNAIDWSKITTGKPTTLTGYGITDPVILDGGNSPAAALNIGTITSQALNFKTANATRMTIDNAGKVGIGVTAPSAKLDVADSFRVSSNTTYPVITIASGSNDAGFQPSLIFRGGRTNGTTFPQTNDWLGEQSFRSQNDAISSRIIALATENHAAGKAGGAISIWTAPNGSDVSAERLRVDQTGFVGIGTSSPGAPLDVKGAIRLSGATSGYTGFKPAAAAGSTVWTLPSVDGSSGQVLATDGSGLLSWTTPSGTGVSTLTVNAPITNGGTATAPNLSIAPATTSANGYLTSTDWNTFNNKQSTTLTNGQIRIGNASNVATGVTLSGDATVTNAGVVTVGKIQGRSVASTTPVTSQVLRYNTATTTWETSYLNITDLKKSDGTTQFQSASCAAGQTLTWSVLTDLFTCSTISITKSQVSDLGTIGTAAAKNFGTAAGNLVELDAGAKIPASLLPAGAATQWTTTGSDIYYSTGKVGIGTNAPADKLHLTGASTNNPVAIRISNDATGTGAESVLLMNPTYGSAYTRYEPQNSANGWITGVDVADYKFKINTYTASPSISTGTKLTIDTTGKVGIGTTTPQATLDVNGGAAVNSSFEGISAYVSSSTAYVIPDTSVNIRRITLNGVTPQITLPAYTSPTTKMYSLTIFLQQDGTGSRVPTFVGSGSDTIKWDSNVAPTIASAAGKVTILQLMKPSDETVWYGSMTWKEN